MSLFGVYGLSYLHGTRKILSEISFEMKAGEICALVGPNGSGKSTLMKAASGILSLKQAGAEGLVRYRGQSFLNQPASSRVQQIAYVGADLRVDFPISARETVMLGRSCLGSGLLRQLREEDEISVRAAMERCLCWEFRDRDLETLSGGERQLVALARALVQGAKVLFLDEALSRMDLNHQARIGRLLKDLAAQGHCVLLVSHDLNLACEWADTALLLKAGRQVAYGPLKETITEERIRDLYPGADLMVGESPVTGAVKVYFGAGGEASSDPAAQARSLSPPSHK